MNRLFAPLCILGAVIAGPLGAATQLPFSGYNYTGPLPDGYLDSGSELTDGVANGLAWPDAVTLPQVDYLTGWLDHDAQITFTFASPVTIGSVSIYFADSNGAAGVGLPGTVTLTDNGSFSQTFTVIDPTGLGTAVECVFDGFFITTDTLTVSFVRNYQWTMISEVQAFAPIPEPSTYAIGLGAVALLVSGWKRRRPAASPV